MTQKKDYYMIDRIEDIVSKLRPVRDQFNKKGFDIRFVGGCVRDLLSGSTPHDFDICTDANPEEQREIYESASIRHVATGLQHGTWLIVIDNVGFEVTSLRQDIDHDGRHATVKYIRDWNLDLARRDLTINAMSLSLDGDLYDPFHGVEDLRNGRVRFVGDPAHRMEEDYLRILRWLRFHARYGKTPVNQTLDQAAYSILCGENSKDYMQGLTKISAERIWSELSRIATGPHAADMLGVIIKLGLAIPCRMPTDPGEPSKEVRRAIESGADAVTIMTVWFGDSVGSMVSKHLAAAWRWSSIDFVRSQYVAKNMYDPKYDLQKAKIYIARDGVPREYCRSALLAAGLKDDAKQLMIWDVPRFPVTGDDLIDRGIPKGEIIGKTLKSLREEWANNNFNLDRKDLFEILNNKENNYTIIEPK